MAATEEAHAGGPPEFDESIAQVLASKIFIDWLRNRQQLLVPLTLDLQKLESGEVDLLMHAMVSAAEADGTFDAADRERLDAALRRLNASDEQRVAFAGVLDAHGPLRDVLSRVRDVQTGSLVYAVSLLAIDRRRRVNRYYLRYLAECLKLPRDLTHALQQRFVSAG